MSYCFRYARLSWTCPLKTRTNSSYLQLQHTELMRFAKKIHIKEGIRSESHSLWKQYALKRMATRCQCSSAALPFEEAADTRSRVQVIPTIEWAARLRKEGEGRAATAHPEPIHYFFDHTLYFSLVLMIRWQCLWVDDCQTTTAGYCRNDQSILLVLRNMLGDREKGTLYGGKR